MYQYGYYYGKNLKQKKLQVCELTILQFLKIEHIFLKIK